MTGRQTTARDFCTVNKIMLGEAPMLEKLNEHGEITATKQVVLPDTDMVPIGIATLAAGNGVPTVRVRLDGVATEAAA